MQRLQGCIFIVRRYAVNTPENAKLGRPLETLVCRLFTRQRSRETGRTPPGALDGGATGASGGVSVEPGWSSTKRLGFGGPGWKQVDGFLGGGMSFYLV